MSGGMVPVCTSVGAIGDTIPDGTDGFLVTPTDATTPSNVLLRLLHDNDRYSRVRAKVIATGSQHAYLSGTLAME